MKDSIRRVASTLGVVGLLAFSVVTLQQIAQYCSEGQVSCLSAAVVFGVPEAGLPIAEAPVSHALPTSTYTESVSSVGEFVFTLVQVTSVYLILISVIVLVVLELFELRYLRRLLQTRTRRA